MWVRPRWRKSSLTRLEVPFYTLSAVTSGVKDVRDVIERAKKNRLFGPASPHSVH